MADPSQLMNLKMDSKTTLKASDIRIHDFTIAGLPQSRVSEDILPDYSQTTSSAPPPATALAMSSVDVDFNSLRVDFGDETPEEKLVREANGFISQKEFRQAIKTLDKVFDIVTAYPEATYLKAYCLHELKQTTESLQTLGQLQGVVLSNRLQTRVNMLRETTRVAILPVANSIYKKVKQSGQLDQAAVLLQQFVDADPAMGKYYYFLACVHIAVKDLVSARQVMQRGLKVCEIGQEELQKLQGELDQRFLPKLLAPARDAYRKKNYSQALRELDEVSSEAQGNALYESFRELLEKQDGKGGGLILRLLGGIASKTTVKATPELRELYEYLVAPELKYARAAFDEKDFKKAERVLMKALDISPQFSVANFMLATSVYQRVAQKVKTRIGKELDDAGARELMKLRESLLGIQKHAELAKSDAGLPDAERLVKSIKEMCEQIESVVKAHEEQVHDAKIVNQLIDDFLDLLEKLSQFNQSAQALMDHGGNAHQVRSDADALYNKLSSMRSTLPSLRSRCKGKDARNIINLVKTIFVDPNYKAMRQIRGL